MDIPSELKAFLSDVYPSCSEIDIGFECFRISRPERLAEFQMGYQCHGLTNEKLIGWNENWIVLGSSNADPLIYCISTGEVLFDRHGSGVWNPRPLFTNLNEMFQCFSRISELVESTGENFLNDQLSIRSEYVHAIKNIIFDLFGQEKGNNIIKILEIREL